MAGRRIDTGLLGIWMDVDELLEISKTKSDRKGNM